ncbi:MAG: S1-C subfamily serine protease [Planctomycetota bacterium]|jgi:S1-C subfamily serine protease
MRAMEHSAVVRIYATTQVPDHDAPWQSETPESGTGSGVVVEPGRVLTGAHVVADATFVQVQKLSDPNKYVAHVESVCHDADLAVLRVEDERFMHEVTVAELGDLPALRDRVSVVGYPVGGEEISITEGVVSRIEVQRYAHSQRHLLAVTVDAAINSGNSGGPVIKDDKVIGIAFQSLEDAENIGEMVPAPIIRHFLRNQGTRAEMRIPGLGLSVQNLENPALRTALGIPEDQSGVLVRDIQYGTSAWGSLKSGDVLLEVDGHSIANNGTIQYGGRYRTSYWVLLGELDVGARLSFLVLRERELREIVLTLAPASFLVPRNSYDCTPTWFVYGGLVFQVLSSDFLRCWTDWWDRGPKEFLQLYYGGKRTEERQEVVVISQVLADEINVGYEACHTESVVGINGVMPKDMGDFVRRVDQSQETVEIQTSKGARIVFNTAEVREAGPRILKRYNIGEDRSANLRGEKVDA